MRQPVPFGKYVLLERISVGGMAEVFKAKSFGVEGFEKILAIKRILPSMAEDADFIEMFIDEAKICGQLNHANICQIFELGRVNDSHFIAMEFIWGKDLLQLQNRFRKIRQTMRPEMAAYVAAKMCEGLDYAHKKKDALSKPLGVIHRDISPQNILVSYEGEVKIIDFGIAKAASRSSKTQAGVLKGKFGYMSPEQVRGLPLDRRSDIFAIGTILYELLTADRVFIGDSDFETLEKVRNVDVPPPSKVNPKCPPALEAIILRALKKEVEDRYQWGSEMQEELQQFLMSYEPVFTAKSLSNWMREQFAIEMKREQEILDEQRKISRDVLSAPAPALDFQTPRPSPALAAPAGRPSPEAELPAQSTKILDDLDIEEMPPEGLSAQATMITGQNGAPGSLHGTPLPQQSTQILGGQHPTPAGGPRAAMGGQPAPLPAPSTVILDTGSGAIGPRPVIASSSGPQAKTLLADAPIMPFAPSRQTPVVPANMPRTPSGGILLPGQNPHTGRVVAPLPYAPARSTLWKDILIGVGVAAALVGGVLGVRAMVKGGGRGTLVVMVTPPAAAEVIVDGALRGRLARGAPLTLKDVPAGQHQVVVRGAEGQYRQTVQLAANDVSVLSAVLTASGTEGSGTSSTAVSTGTGALKLNLASAGARVYVDEVELADGATARPIPLRAGLPHQIRVTKPLREDARFAITVSSGQTAVRDVELLPAYGKVKVTTEPPGAEVHVNGKTVGVTPVTVSDLDPGKSARVSIHLSGYAAITKNVGFDRSLEQELALTLEASGAASSHKKPKDDKTTETKATPAAPTSNEPGFLIANTQPWAKVVIDGKDTGKTTPIAPRSKIPLKPGKHLVTFVANGKKFNFDIVVKAGEDVRVIKQLTDSGM